MKTSFYFVFAALSNMFSCFHVFMFPLFCRYWWALFDCFVRFDTIFLLADNTTYSFPHGFPGGPVENWEKMADGRKVNGAGRCVFTLQRGNGALNRGQHSQFYRLPSLDYCCIQYKDSKFEFSISHDLFSRQQLLR